MRLNTEMKITAIKAYPVWVGFRNQLLVKVETDKGVHGWGESGLSSRELAVKGAVEHFREFLIGKDPRCIGALWQQMYRSQYFEGGRVLTAAIAAIDVALYDLVAKSMDVPVYQLLGGKQRDFVPCFASIPQDTPGEEMVQAAKLLMDSGWTSFRFNPTNPTEMKGQSGRHEPTEAIAYVADWLPKVRAAVGREAVIGYDFHHRLSVAEAASFLQQMPLGTLDYIEEPIRAESPEAYEALRQMTPVPFAIGEEFSSKWAFKPYLERNITQYARIDVANVGGLTEAVKVAAMAEANYIDVMPHNPLGAVCTAASVHLAAAIPNFSWLESRQSPAEDLVTNDETICPNPLKLDGSRIPVPNTPGLGVEINEEALVDRDFKLFESPHLRRTDGSFTNW
ncbi:Mandelate racemase/muconate lactonizing protein [Coraliomargarita akajimensis DSM 45221]|uniref:Mandelate racemase/muconate lactonizing protein n=2 Tax=Coraliomargarita TaxID=442430 RepID=D5EL04_CORAD|nr:Mandelate racemase/muconate lactonizing protein [Coraliomargarita akajimensis DSM 45221]